MENKLSLFQCSLKTFKFQELIFVNKIYPALIQEFSLY